MAADEREPSGPRPSLSMAIRPGLRTQIRKVVERSDLASEMGNPGAEVLATPTLIAWLEMASSDAVRPHLPPGTLTVGTMIHVRHQAATPVGAAVTIKSRLREVDGRRLVFDVEAHDAEEQLTGGTHERFIVDTDRFRDGVRRKQPR